MACDRRHVDLRQQRDGSAADHAGRDTADDGGQETAAGEHERRGQVPDAVLDAVEPAIYPVETPIHLLESEIDLLEAEIHLLETPIDAVRKIVEALVGPGGSLHALTLHDRAQQMWLFM